MNIAWTNHLEERLLQRGISKSEAFETIQYPHTTLRPKQGGYRFVRNYPHKSVTVVANDQNGTWVIITAWSDQKGSSFIRRSNSPFLTNFVQGLLVRTVKLFKRLLFNQ